MVGEKSVETAARLQRMWLACTSRYLAHLVTSNIELFQITQEYKIGRNQSVASSSLRCLSPFDENMEGFSHLPFECVLLERVDWSSMDNFALIGDCNSSNLSNINESNLHKKPLTFLRHIPHRQQKLLHFAACSFAFSRFMQI